MLLSLGASKFSTSEPRAVVPSGFRVRNDGWLNRPGASAERLFLPGVQLDRVAPRCSSASSPYSSLWSAIDPVNESMWRCFGQRPPACAVPPRRAPFRPFCSRASSTWRSGTAKTTIGVKEDAEEHGRG